MPTDLWQPHYEQPPRPTRNWVMIARRQLLARPERMGMRVATRLSPAGAGTADSDGTSVQLRICIQRGCSGRGCQTHDPHSSSEDASSRLKPFTRRPDAVTAVDVETASLAAFRSFRCFFLNARPGTNAGGVWARTLGSENQQRPDATCQIAHSRWSTLPFGRNGVHLEIGDRILSPPASFACPRPLPARATFSRTQWPPSCSKYRSPAVRRARNNPGTTRFMVAGLNATCMRMATWGMA